MRSMVMAQVMAVSLLSASAWGREPSTSYQAADANFYARAVEVLKLYEGEIGSGGFIGSGWGTMNVDDNGLSSAALRRIAAGLKLLELNETTLIPPNFPALVENWVAANVFRYQDVGTHADYDFALIQIINLIYHFKDNPSLLTNNAIWSLIYQQKPPAARTVYFDGQSTTEKMMYSSLPETENHVLMSYVWKYLVNQWIHRNYRSDSRVAAYFQAGRHVNGADLESLMLRMVGRITRNDYFETNSRAYQAFTFHALLTLFSYAESPKLKAACFNAINFTVAKYAFQSFEGMRYTVQRRNWSYRNNMGVFDNDYFPTMIGALSGDYRTDTRLASGSQHKGFTLWAILNEYRIPGLIHDFILNKDNHRPGYGFWAKMQPRFTHADYPLNGPPRYWPNTNVNGHVIHAIEMHYGNRHLMNSTGGDWMPYFPYPAAIAVPPFYWQAFDDARNYDIITKPNTVLVKGIESLTVMNNLLTGYNPDNGMVTPSMCNGVYKSFAFGQFATGILQDEVAHSTFVINNPNSRVTLHFSTLNAPQASYYVVLGEVKRGSLNLYGFYEVVHSSAFANIDAFVARVKAYNQYLGEDVLGVGEIPNLPKYRLAVSGEVVVPNPYYVTGADGNAFVEIYPNAGTALFSLDEYTFNGSSVNVVSSQPLLEVYQLDALDKFTGTLYVDNGVEGVLALNNPYLGQTMTINALDHNAPSVSGNFKASPLTPRLLATPIVPILSLLGT